MTSRERMVTAFRNERPDMVPVSPDMSNMIPSRLTGKPFWDIYLYGDPPLWRAYIDAVKYFGFDGWLPIGGFTMAYNNISADRETVHQDEERIVQKVTYHTPGGELWEEVVYPRWDPPSVTIKMIKRIPEDFEIYLNYFIPDASQGDDSEYWRIKQEMGELGVVGPSIWYPGMQDLFSKGDLDLLVYAYYDHPELFERYRELTHNWMIQLTERILRVKPDFLMLGASGTLTLQSPSMFRHLGLPTIQETTRMAKEAGVVSHLHSCGYERELVKMCAEETDLSSIEPLEIPPMGDCDLAELKRLYGCRIALKGNLHTTEVMLKGTPEDVERESKKAIDDAGAGGGFVLSTGDQCGRDTPDENIFKMIETARTYGVYPLTVEKESVAR